jgi:hypothetical protein
MAATIRKDLDMKLLMTMGLLGTGLALATSALAAQTYYIDQLVNYPAPCTQATLWDDTTALKSRMDAASWTGVKYTDGAAWVKDFREGCSSVYGSNGLDGTYGDNKSFTIFSGHGSSGTLYFGTQNDTCSININNQVRLGSMNGAQAAVAMYISCTTLHDAGYNEWVQQQLGFFNTVGNNTAAYGSFFDDTWTKSNARAWLDRLSGQPAIVISYSNGTNSCWPISNGAMLKANAYTSPRGGGPTCGAGQPQHQECILHN